MATEKNRRLKNEYRYLVKKKKSAVADYAERICITVKYVILVVMFLKAKKHVQVGSGSGSGRNRTVIGTLLESRSGSVNQDYCSPDRIWKKYLGIPNTVYLYFFCVTVKIKIFFLSVCISWRSASCAEPGWELPRPPRVWGPASSQRRGLSPRLPTQ